MTTEFRQKFTEIAEKLTRENAQLLFGELSAIYLNAQRLQRELNDQSSFNIGKYVMLFGAGTFAISCLLKYCLPAKIKSKFNKIFNITGPITAASIIFGIVFMFYRP